jgi:hypothetical protein
MSLLVLGVVISCSALGADAQELSGGLVEDVVVSTLPGPDRTIGGAPMTFFGTPCPIPGEATVYVTANVNAISFGAIVGAWWPEIVAGVAVIAGLVLLWRTFRRRRVPGEPYCRRCNYRLTSVDAERCPECGNDLKRRRGRVTGRRRTLRFIAAGLLILVAPVVYGLTFKSLPRKGPTFRRWWSVGLYDLADRYQIKWLLDRAISTRSIIEVDLATGERVRVIKPAATASWWGRMALDTGGRELFAIDSGEGGLEVLRVRTSSGRVLDRFAVSDSNRAQLGLVGYSSERQSLLLLSSADKSLSALDCSNGVVNEVTAVSYETRPTGGLTAQSMTPPIVVSTPPDHGRVVIAECAGRGRTWLGTTRLVHTNYDVTVWAMHQSPAWESSPGTWRVSGGRGGSLRVAPSPMSGSPGSRSAPTADTWLRSSGRQGGAIRFTSSTCTRDAGSRA